MKLLEDRIRKDGIIEQGEVLKVDSFLNHQMDVKLFQEMGREWYRLFKEDHVNKILTIEASGIGIACVAALEFDVPVIFAKKSKTKNIAGEVYSSKGGRAGRRLYPLCRRGQVNSFRKREGPPGGRTMPSGGFLGLLEFLMRR